MLGLEFGSRLLSFIREPRDPHSIVFSPFNLMQAFGALQDASNGDSKLEVDEFLGAQDLDPLIQHLSQQYSSSQSITFSNYLLLRDDCDINPEFVQTHPATHLQSFSARNLPQTVQFINQAVNRDTKGKVRQILNAGDVDERSVVFFVSTLYFKGTWQIPFPVEDNEIGPFNHDNDVQVEYMFLHQSVQGYLDTPEFQLLEMEYKSPDNMVFGMLLPKGTNSFSLPHALEDLQHIFHERLVLDAERISVLQVPKFKIECTFKHAILDALVQSGADALLNNADLSNLANPPPGAAFQINMVIHKAVIEVDNTATVATAATVIGGIESAAAPSERPPSPPPIEFIADHTFVFYIRDTQEPGTILFLGTFNGREGKED